MMVHFAIPMPIADEEFVAALDARNLVVYVSSEIIQKRFFSCILYYRRDL